MRNLDEHNQQRDAGLLMLEAILNTAVDAVIVISARGEILKVNPSAERLFGYGTEEMLGRNINMLMPSPHRERHDGYIDSYLRGGVAKIIGIGRHVEGQRKDGSLFPLHLSVNTFTVEGERYFAGVMHDLTERVRLQNEISRQLSIFESVFNTVPHVLIICDQDRRISLCNASVTRHFGYEPGELAGQHLSIMWEKASDFAVFETRFLALKSMQSAKSADPLAATYRRKDGGIFPGEVVGAQIAADDGYPIGVLCLIRDVSRDLEQQMALRKAQRMEAFGQLTGGIAHDFNNLLTVITGNHELLEMRLKDEKDLELLKRAEAATEMGARLTSRLLTFARRRQFETTRVNLNEHVLSMSDLLRRTLGEPIDLTTVLAPKLWDIRADPSEIENAILNLAINARDAMPDGGRLIIETAPVQIDADEIGGDKKLPAGRYVRLSVSDTGTGMPSDVLQRAFEPFFTTKQPGKGTGLGLSTIYGFVQQSGGTSTIYSELGHGTTVNLYFPKADATAGESEGEQGRDAVPLSAGETVLLVEDNPEVREVTKSRLAALGYRVVLANSGPEAVQVLESDQPVDLVFSDVVMAGGMSGFDVARWVRTNRPGHKIVLATGYADEVMRSGDDQLTDIKVLRKPYSRAELAQALRHALEA